MPTERHFWKDNVIGSRALTCAISDGLKMKEDPVPDRHSGSLFTAEDEPPSWKYHHGCVMYLSRPDRLSRVSSGLQELQESRELKRQKSAPTSPKKRWQTGLRKARLARSSINAFSQGGRPSTTPALDVERLLDKHEAERAMNKSKAVDDMFHPQSFTPSRFVTLEEGLASFKHQVDMLGDLYDAEEKEHEDVALKKERSYSVPTPQEWEKINAFWMELNVKYGSLAQAFKEFDLNGNGDLSCIEFTQSCETLKVGGDDYHWQVRLFQLLDGDGSGNIGADEFMGARLVLPESEEGKAEAKRKKQKFLTVGDKLATRRASENAARRSGEGRAPSPSETSSLEGDPSDPEFFWAFLRQFFPDSHPGGSYLRAFRKIDTNRNADLSQSEFVTGMQMIKYPGTRTQWKKLFFELDDDRDGSVRLGEFSNWEAPGSISKNDRENEALLAGKRYQARLKQEIEKTKLKDFILDSAKHTSTEKRPGLTQFDADYDKSRFSETGGTTKSSNGWTRTYGEVMKLTRKDNCQKVREGLQRMADERVTETSRVRQGFSRPLSPGRNKAPPSSALRPFPSRASYDYFVPQYQLDLPITTELRDLVANSEDVWRRRTYN
jgi:Ca2+-binding EF-hand superfamily protein